MSSSISTHINKLAPHGEPRISKVRVDRLYKGISDDWDRLLDVADHSDEELVARRPALCDVLVAKIRASHGPGGTALTYV
jgi:hypothetical protein